MWWHRRGLTLWLGSKRTLLRLTKKQLVCRSSALDITARPGYVYYVSITLLTKE